VLAGGLYERASGAAGRPLAGYRRRTPERTVLHELVVQQTETMLAELRDADPDSGGLPRYVERELAAYLRCGILAHGFARVRCQTCRDEIVVAVSCKSRGICPSCTARRMADTAAAVVDRRRPHRVQAQAPVARRPHRARDAAGRVFASFVQHHSAPAPAFGHLQRDLRAAKDRAKLRALVPVCEDAVAPPCSTTTAAPRPRAGRVPWADLLRRVFADDVLQCPCGGRRSVIAVVTDPGIARTLLGALGLAHEPAAFAPARAPPQVEFDWDDAS